MNFNMDRAHSAETKAAVCSVIDSGVFLNGTALREFEEDFADLCEAPYCAGVGSGTDALRLALLALGIKPGDEVISPAFGVSYPALAVSSIGARNVFVDCNPRTLLMDLNELPPLADGHIRAVIPVHLYGRMVNMWTLRDIAADNHWLVVEDAAQCHGAKFRGHPPGFYSDAATFSFYPTKNLGAFGEGGAVVTRYPLVDERVRILRNGGRTSHSIHELRGFSSYLDDLQAAALQIKLKYLRSATQKRQACAARYQSALQGVGDITFPEMPEPGVDSTNVYHLFVIQTKRRAALIEYLDFMGIPSLIHYPSTVPMQPAFRDEYLGSNFPRAEYASRTVLSLPLWPDMTTKEQDKVIKAIKQVFSTKGP